MRVLVQSLALDVVGIGLESGLILMHNLRRDETLLKFYQEWGPVTSLSFRTGRYSMFDHCFFCGFGKDGSIMVLNSFLDGFAITK